MEAPKDRKASKRCKVTFVEYGVMECNDGGTKVSGMRQMMLEMLQQVISEVNGLKEVVNIGIEKQIKLEEKLDNMRGVDDKIFAKKFGILCKDVVEVWAHILLPEEFGREDEKNRWCS
ncbi:hypothetical protein V6N12_007792 [Hibiscus sabdariffa]|uniref:Uncharacterized protein n=1 Tax=Hibiscus sabdariffa TaxID=183260 RepID=A0ABR2F2U8_9ROSI